MTAAAIRVHARVRVGGSLLAVDVADIDGAIDVPAQGLGRTPRRAGAIAGTVQIGGDVIPVVALDRWVDLGERPANSTDEARLLVLRDASGSRLAVSVDGLMGVQAVAADRVQRIHRDERPDELFDSAIATKEAQAGPVWLLEAGRLIRLASVWRESAGVDGNRAGRADRAATAKAAQRQPAAAIATARYAVFELGGGGSGSSGGQAAADNDAVCYAIPAAAVERVVQTPKPESVLKIGRRSCGVTGWGGRKMPMIDLHSLLGVGGDASTDWMAVVAHGGLRMGLCVTAARQLVDLRADAIRPAVDEPLMAGRAVVDGLGTVHVIDLDKLSAAAPELVIGGRLNDGQPTAAAIARARPAGKPHIVFGADRDYATPVDGILGIVGLSPDVTEKLGRGESALLQWQGQSVRVANMPSIGSAAAAPARFAFLVETGPADGDIVGIAVHSLRSWLPAHDAQTSTMRVGASGDLNMVTRSDDGRRESLVVVHLAEMAYLIS